MANEADFRKPIPQQRLKINRSAVIYDNDFVRRARLVEDRIQRGTDCAAFHYT